MKIDGPKSGSLPAQEPQEIFAVSNQRLPRTGVFPQSGSNLLPALELGQEIDAIVIQELSQGKLLLNASGSLIEAENPGGLSAGQHLRLRVEQLQPQVVLHITQLEPTIESEAMRLLRAHVPFHADIGETLENLQKQLASHFDLSKAGEILVPRLNKLREFVATLLTGESPPSVERLLTLMKDGGLHYEAKLFHALVEAPGNLRDVVDGDLKGLLLAALQESEGASASTDLQRAISGQLTNLESQQAVNLLAQRGSDAFQFQVPFFNGSGFSTVTLSIDHDGKGSAGERGKHEPEYNILFLLDLEDLGRIRIDAHLNKNDLRVIFYVEQPRTVEWVTQELPSFQETLRTLGYREVLLAARPLREIPRDKAEKFDALAIGAPSKINLLDLKA
jgi:hypothetical protein